MSTKARAIALYLCAALCPLAIPARAVTIVNPATGISVSVVRDGTYRIDTSTLSWTFSGKIAAGVSDIRIDNGKDLAGEFQEIAFEEKIRGGRHFAIRMWPGRPGVLFTQAVTAVSLNPAPFPRFTVF